MNFLEIPELVSVRGAFVSTCLHGLYTTSEVSFLQQVKHLLSARLPVILSIEKSRDTSLNVTTSETSQICQENHLTPGDTSDSPMDKMSTGVVRQRLLQNQAWKECKAGFGLQRDEDDILLCDDVEQDDTDLSPEERKFLQEFPIIKREMEEDIRKAHALADEFDRIQETVTKTKVVTGSVAVASSVMSTLGLLLAPVTARGSLILSAAGTGLETVASAASIVTNITEKDHNKRFQAQVSGQVSTHDQEVSQAVDPASYDQHANKLEKNFKDIMKNIDALMIAKDHPRLANAAKRRLTSGQVSSRRDKQVQKAFQGTTLAMKTGTRLMNTAMAGLSLSKELGSLMVDYKQLKEGAKSELAGKLRANALEQEQKLRELTRLYETLKKKEERLGNSFSLGAMRSSSQALSQAWRSRILCCSNCWIRSLFICIEKDVIRTFSQIPL
ncbi:PREDICTED: apolipoprotein L6-like [Hipposideros armiger]|uniref:Apolipoprotein L6-like n=1 Tax=Hipposideros armiger TaxID=186990 RepID=A0A8B7PZH8_HIPAR|nr:PREDICTED: apolipoprotein L6-like [Hipposideros armiger]